MARGKKKEEALTPEERLAEALVPVEEQPYSVPENWCWTYIRYAYEVTSSKRVHKEDWLTQGIPFYRTRELVKLSNQGYVNNELFISMELYEKFKETYGVPQIGDLLISGVGTIGVPYIIESNQKFYFKDGNVIWFKNHMLLAAKYAYYLYKSVFMGNQIHAMSSGTTVDTYTIVNANMTKIPVPPLSEQQRIVDCIESLFGKLDEAKEKAQAVVDSFETRKAAVLYKAFTGELTAQWRKDNFIEASLLLKQIDEEIVKTKKKTIKKVASVIDKNYMKFPSNWMIVDLDRISKKITDGEHKTPNRVDSYCGNYLLSARNIYNDSLLLEDVDYVDGSEYKKISKRCNPKKGDVLISCSGSIGRTCVIDDDNNYCMVRSAAMVSICKCNARYIMYAIQSDIVQHQIKRLSKQTAQANLFIGAIAAINIPLPPIEEQTEIVRIIDSIITKEIQAKNIAENILDQVETMKKAILARAFRGELGTNDPAEESAVELLKTVI